MLNKNGRHHIVKNENNFFKKITLLFLTIKYDVIIDNECIYLNDIILKL